MAKVTRDFIQTEFGQLHVRLAQPAKSSNIPLLCLHMSPQSGRDFEDFVRIASEDRLVIAPDYHGYGESDPPPDTPDVTIADYARTIWQALDLLGTERLDVVGHHTGSKVAIEMARQHLSRVRSLTLMSISVDTSYDDSKPAKTFSPIAMDDAGVGLNKWWQGMKAYYPKDISLDYLFRQYVESLRAEHRFHWGFRAASAYNAELIENVQSLDLPITVICLSDDLAEITPQIMPYLKQGAFVDKPDWKSGFLKTRTDDVVKTVIDSIEGMTAIV